MVALTPRSNGGLWVGATFPQRSGGRGGRIFKFEDQRWGADLSPYLWPQDTVFARVRAVLEDSTGRLWAATSGAGLFCWEAKTRWQRLSPEGPLAQLDCSCLALDSEGTVWVGTMGGQLLQIRPRPVRTLHLPVPAEKNVLLNACATHDGSVWVGTDGAGVFHYRGGQFTRFAEEQGLPSGHIGAILEDRRTNLWVGTWQGLFQLRGDKFQPIPGPLPLRQVVLALCQDHEGKLWAGTGGGVVRLGQGEAKAFGRDEGVDHFYIRGIAEDQQGRIWLAIMDRGLYLLKEGRFERYGAGQWSGQEFIRALHADSAGSLWIATMGAGLVRLNQGRFTQWGLNDGLPSDRIVSVSEDNSGNLWFSSENGVFGCPKPRFEEYRSGEARLLFWQLSVAEGLDVKKCSGAGQPVVARSSDGRLWVPDWHGLAVFNPAEVPGVWSPWPATVEEVLVDGQPQPKAAGVVEVTSGARSFEFHFSSPNLRTPERVRFRYRLKGSDPGWVDAEERRTAYYGHLAPGAYEFRVMAGGPSGAWQEAKQGLNLLVRPQFWERGSVRFGAALVVVGLATGAAWQTARARARRRLVRIEAQQAMEQERRRISRDLHDDMGAGLAEVVLVGEVALQADKEPMELKDHVTEMTEKTRQLVAAMDEIVWTVNPRNDSIPNLVFYAAEHARKFFAPTLIHCRLDIPADLPAVALPAAARHNMFLAVKEALHNVAKHSGAQEVWFHARCADAQFALEIQDDGKGFDITQLSTMQNGGDGLANMRHRLESLGGRAEIESAPGRGTTVRFRLPLVAS